MAEVGGSAGAVRSCTICKSFHPHVRVTESLPKTYSLQEMYVSQNEGCIGCGILVDGIRKFVEVTAGLSMSDIIVFHSYHNMHKKKPLVALATAFWKDESRAFWKERFNFHTLHGMIRQVIFLKTKPDGFRDRENISSTIRPSQSDYGKVRLPSVL
jgi:hypothetical protein